MYIILAFVKVHPSSISIEGTLGNFRLCDLSLRSDHCWGWLCDLRDQEAVSLIQVLEHFAGKRLNSFISQACSQSLSFFLSFFPVLQFTFNSYSIEDDDYEGYDYSLTGRLSAVRIVFLYRFVQEVLLFLYAIN